eukprot:3492002-Prymnesium_polylepis.1
MGQRLVGDGRLGGKDQPLADGVEAVGVPVGGHDRHGHWAMQDRAFELIGNRLVVVHNDWVGVEVDDDGAARLLDGPRLAGGTVDLHEAGHIDGVRVCADKDSGGIT